MPDSISPELRAERLRVFRIMYEHHTVRLVTADDGTRWLTDQFVLLDVTDSPLHYVGPFTVPDDAPGELAGVTVHDYLPDGLYKLTQANGLEPKEGVLDFDVERYLSRLESCAWFAAAPSEWSVAEHPGKAMLWAVEDRKTVGTPALLGESTWTALRRHHDDLLVEWTPDLGGAGLFRFAARRMRIVAYVAGIHIPDGQEGIASSLARTVYLTRQLATA